MVGHLEVKLKVKQSANSRPRQKTATLLFLTSSTSFLTKTFIFYSIYIVIKIYRKKDSFPQKSGKSGRVGRLFQLHHQMPYSFQKLPPFLAKRRHLEKSEEVYCNLPLIRRPPIHYFIYTGILHVHTFCVIYY